VTFSIEVSDDNSTFYRRTDGAAEIINLSTTAQAGEIFLPVRDQQALRAPGGDLRRRRLDPDDHLSG
jgi:hypothetical protein